MTKLMCISSCLTLRFNRTENGFSLDEVKPCADPESDPACSCGSKADNLQTKAESQGLAGIFSSNVHDAFLLSNLMFVAVHKQLSTISNDTK